MSEHLQINAFRYPNFAALARDSHWFRKTSTVAERSARALPAILTGRYTKDIAPPTAANYPENLFTWLAGNYELNSFENMTSLCPEELCREPIGRSFSERMRMTLSDLAFVYLHVILPADLAQTLPSVTATMRDFGAAKPSAKAASPGGSRLRLGFSQFLNWIRPADGPVLYFMHTFVPHAPWTYLPSGKQYGPPRFPHGISQKGTWGSDQWETVQGFQRHLLQTRYADRLLGTLLGRLREVDLYDRSLIIVTADHGLSFWPNESHRIVGEKNQADILLYRSS